MIGRAIVPRRPLPEDTSIGRNLNGISSHGQHEASPLSEEVDHDSSWVPKPHLAPASLSGCPAHARRNVLSEEVRNAMKLINLAAGRKSGNPDTAYAETSYSETIGVPTKVQHTVSSLAAKYKGDLSCGNGYRSRRPWRCA